MAAARSRGETLPKARSDAYVGLLGLSLLALIIAIVFAYLNWDQIKEKPKPVQMTPPGGGARTPATPGPGTAPGVPPAGAPGAGGTPPAGAPGNVPPAGGNPPVPPPGQNK